MNRDKWLEFWDNVLDYALPIMAVILFIAWLFLTLSALIVNLFM